MEQELKDFIQALIGSTSPVGWPGTYVAVYETDGNVQYVVTYDFNFNIRTVAYNGKTLTF